MLEIFSEITYISAFVAGVITVFLPCTLPVLLGYIGVVSGSSLHKPDRKVLVFNTICFSIGFIIIYSILGAVAGWFGQFSNTVLLIHGPVLKIITIIGGIFLILFGLILLGALPWLKFFKNTHFIKIPNFAKNTYWGYIIIGIVVAVGWSPCISPILGSLLVYAGSGASVWFGFSLLLVFTLGIVIPLIITSYFLGLVFNQSNKMKKFSKYLSIIGGVVLILLGLLFVGGFTNILFSLTQNSFLYKLF